MQFEISHSNYKNKKLNTMTLVKHHAKNLNNVFDEFFGFPSAWGRDFNQNWNIPAANIHETNDGFHIELNAPGRNKEDFKISVENGLLIIGFEKKEETEQKDYKTIRREFSYNSFKRSFSLDDKVNADNIQAKYENGVLKLFIPKKEEVKSAPKQISVQ
jgi:HSP20 family protein